MIARSQLWFFPMVGQKFQAKNAWKINVPTVVLLQRQHCERKGNFQSEAIFGVETNASIHGSSSLLGTRNTEARQESPILGIAATASTPSLLPARGGWGAFPGHSCCQRASCGRTHSYAGILISRTPINASCNLQGKSDA